MDSLALTLGRILFGGHLIFNTVNHFTNLSKLTGYAQPKGVPAVQLAVAGGGILLLIGGISVVNIFPVIGVIAIAFFPPLRYGTHARVLEGSGSGGQDRRDGTFH